MNTAIFGGTFNPFHIGHEKMLNFLCQLDFIDRVLVIPDKIPPHKEVDFLASDFDRLEMCNIACKGLSKATVSDMEIKQEGKSYSIKTVRRLKELYPNDKFFFCCGGDMIACLDKWYDFENLIKETSFIAFCRNNSENFQKDVEKMRAMGAEIIVLNEEIPFVSSTDFRNSLKGELLPEKIYDYISKKEIYNAR